MMKAVTVLLNDVVKTSAGSFERFHRPVQRDLWVDWMGVMQKLRKKDKGGTKVDNVTGRAMPPNLISCMATQLLSLDLALFKRPDAR